MRLLSVHARNFRVHADTYVDLPEGVVGLIGANESGKSSLLEAALWALFGAVALRGTKAGLLWHGAGPKDRVEVTVRFALGGEVYTIERTEADAKLRGSDGGIIVQGSKPVNDDIPERVGMSYAEFVTSHVILQKEFSRLFAMLPTERQAFIRQVMGVGRIDDALKACRKRKASYSEEIRGMEAMLGPREPLVETLVETETAVARCAARLERARDDHDETKLHAEEVERQFDVSKDAARKHQSLSGDRDRHADEVRRCEIELERLAASLRSQRTAAEKVAAEEPRLAVLPALRDEMKAIERAEVYASEKRSLQVRFDELLAEITDAEFDLDAATDTIESFDTAAYEAAQKAVRETDARLRSLMDARKERAAKARAAYATHQRQGEELDAQLAKVRALGEDGECPTCTQRLGGALVSVTAALAEQAEAQQKLAEDARLEALRYSEPDDEEHEADAAKGAAEEAFQRLHEEQKLVAEARRWAPQLTAAIEKKGAERSRILARLKELPEGGPDARRRRDVREQIAVLENLDRSLVSYRSAAGQIPSTESEIARWTTAKELAEEAAAAATEALASLTFDADVHERIEQAALQAGRKLQEAHTAMVRADEALRGALAQHVTAEKALATYDERAQRLEDARAAHLLHEKVDARLSAFRVAVAGTIRPEMEELVSGYVSLLTDGRHESVEITDDFAIVLQESGRPSEVVSGGAEDVAALAMRLAISQMIAERAGQQIEFIAMDEPFGSLDEVRRASVVNLVRLLKKTFPQVLTMSHVAETREMVDHAIELEFDEATRQTRVA